MKYMVNRYIRKHIKRWIQEKNTEQHSRRVSRSPFLDLGKHLVLGPVWVEPHLFTHPGMFLWVGLHYFLYLGL